MIEPYFVDSNGNLIDASTDNSYFKSVISFLEKFRNSEEIKVTTSGSTGAPKEIFLSKPQIIASVNQTKEAFGLTPKDIAICSLPVNYIAGKLMLLRAEILGMKAVVIEPSSNPLANLSSTIKSLFEQNKGRLFFAFVPLQIEKILQNEESKSIIKDAKVILSGGAPLSDFVASKLYKSNLNVYETYGMTETVTHVAIRPLSDRNDLPFVFLRGIEHRINENNCLSIKGLTTNHIWIQTNDVIQYQQENSFKIIGRLDNVINSGGIKLQPEQIEKRIGQLFVAEGIKNAFFCYGKPDQQLGQKMVLFIEGIQSMKIKPLLIANLPKFEIPKEVFFLEKFERTSSKKIKRKETASKLL